MKKKVLVEGPILTQSGYGEHARLVMRSLRSQEEFFDIYALPVNWGKTSWLFEDDEERKWIDSIINKTVITLQQNPQFDIYVHVGIPSELKPEDVQGLTQATYEIQDKLAGYTLDLSNIENIRRRKNGHLVIVDPVSMH